VYLLATLVLCLGLVASVVIAFGRSAGLGVFMLVVGSVGTLVSLALIRMILQVYRATVR